MLAGSLLLSEITWEGESPCDLAKANRLRRIAFFDDRAIAFQFRNNQKAIALHFSLSKNHCLLIKIVVRI
jgi:hypothetical protein